MTSPENIETYLAGLAAQDTLRLITCGSVDDGKSTLIGRLLYDAQSLFDDQLATLAAESRDSGTQNGELDFALLVDGLAAEREQGITIDVAYRFLATEKRRFILADTPGHVEYTRNMVTAASTAALAIILIDARQGILEQTRRHSLICSLMGIRQIILAVNKMDLMGYDEDVFVRIRDEYQEIAASLGFEQLTAIPISALHGDMVSSRGGNMDWYQGPHVFTALEEAGTGLASAEAPMRLPVQWVNRPSPDFRGYAGRIASGRLNVGDQVRILPSGTTTSVTGLTIGTENRLSAQAEESVTVTLADDVGLSRGDVIAAPDNPPQSASQFEAEIVWMGRDEALPGRRYEFKFGPQRCQGTITGIKFTHDISTGNALSSTSLAQNDIARTTINLNRAIVFDPYEENREMGSFVMIDRESHETVAAGMIRFALRRASNIHHQATDIGRPAREKLNGHRGRVYWFTGLSGSGKSTLANAFEIALHARGIHTYILDGDNIRHGLNKDLGFTDADRVENIRRIGEVARLMVDAGIVVLTAFISPFRAEREMARDLFAAGDFIEVFVDTPLAICEKRDVKGLYKKARAGDIPNFTGISSPYEPPLEPECRLNTDERSVEELVEELLAHFDRINTPRS
ncbi:adenylyl-sulfate kinase [Alphaproteobacteria bacterium LSUCC0684]